MNNIPVATKEQEERMKEEAMTFDDLMKRFNKGVDQVKEYQGSRLTKEELKVVEKIFMHYIEKNVPTWDIEHLNTIETIWHKQRRISIEYK